uniref:G-protein coupled receptors family 1 profile domain-containing protein n=1 Tax=Sus scrofa TaxID=9823 RepID=A0A4X1SGQ2_PIG
MQSRNINAQRENSLKITKTNLTIMMDIVILGFADRPQFHWFLFVVSLVIYLISPLGSKICYVSVTLPRMLMEPWTRKGNIYFLTCATQMCFFLMLGVTEFFLLSVMAYDHYVAICNLLHYPLIMNSKVCFQLVVASWISGTPVEIGQTCQIFSLPFCGSNQINHFCDIPPLLKLSCGDIFVNEMVVYIFAALFVTLPFMSILGLYIRIIATILKLSSKTGKAMRKFLPKLLAL